MPARNEYDAHVHDGPSEEWKYYASISGDTTLPRESRGIYVGAAGDLYAETMTGNMEPLVSVPAGSFWPIRTRKLGSGTSATLITVLY